MNWSTHTIRISLKGDVSLRNPRGRAIGWAAVDPSRTPDEVAAEWLSTFKGATLDNRHSSTPVADLESQQPPEARQHEDKGGKHA